MTSLLKQATATTILLGPFLDDTDGKTAETGLTISQADVLLWKEGGTTLAQKNESTACTHRSNGLYTCPINATDTNTLGVLSVSVAESGALPVRHDYLVVPADVYEILVNSGTTATKFKNSIGTVSGVFTASGTPTTTVVQSDASAATGAYDGRWLFCLTGTNAGLGRIVNSYSNTNGEFQLVSGFPSAPSAGDTFIVI